MRKFWGGIEAGGTKFHCAYGQGPNKIKAEARFPTTTPVETLGNVIEFFMTKDRYKTMKAMGIASFGPVDLRPASATFGFITNTPKEGWAQTDISGIIHRALDVPVVMDTDVNGAALAENLWGAAQQLETFVYLTIGTGIGGGGMVNGNLMHGLLHPEMGHLLIPHDWETDTFEGICPFHNDCLEGLASGPALEARWGKKAQYLPSRHPAWDLEARYLALGLTNIILTVSPQRIILGGGVMEQKQLFYKIRSKVKNMLYNYIESSDIIEDIDTYIVPPKLGAKAGMFGALALAQRFAR